MLSSPLARLFALLILLVEGLAAAAPRPLPDTRNHLVFQDNWDEAEIADFRRFDLLVLQPRRYAGTRSELQAIPRNTTAVPIVIDGDFADWAADSTIHLGANDPTGDQPSGEPEKDLTDAWLAFRDSTLFLCFRVDAPIEQWDWRYAVLLDTDADATTGAQSTGLGADLMILGPGWTYRLDAGWNAAWLGQAPHALGQDPRYVEMALPASLVGPWGSRMRVLIRFGDTVLGYDIAPTFDYRPDVDRYRPYPPGL